MSTPAPTDPKGLDEIDWMIRKFSIQAVTDSVLKGLVTPELYKFENELKQSMLALVKTVRIDECWRVGAINPNKTVEEYLNKRVKKLSNEQPTN